MPGYQVTEFQCVKTEARTTRRDWTSKAKPKSLQAFVSEIFCRWLHDGLIFHMKPRGAANTSCVKDLVQLCVDTNTIDHCNQILKRMQSIVAVSPGAWKTYHALASDSSELSIPRVQLSGPISEFFKTAARQLLRNSQSITDATTGSLPLALRQTSPTFLTHFEFSERNVVAETILQSVAEIILAFDFSTLVDLSESDINGALGSVVELFDPCFPSGCGVAASQVIFDRLHYYSNQKEYMYAVLYLFIKDLGARTV
ncbi:hypothetical protein EDD18DRAFT_1098144 [Armillaria luteobubalina]|uniref:Uncharacterized protein n=1 Tax=Armillaria luteobubalina TaxID=153913 RepID=A0AA39QKG3_9AGAR|nr:hypothetical protein EDD18DRAFT_1098144 [Armillaria luteobubalina]